MSDIVVIFEPIPTIEVIIEKAPDVVIEFPSSQGVSGLSAYQIAVENGFVWTESEWIDSLWVDKTASVDFTNQSVVNFSHNLWKYPAITIIDSAWDEVEWDVFHISMNQVQINFSSSFTWKLFCN